jgi:sugar-specific transcriptional regulator TrmB
LTIILIADIIVFMLKQSIFTEAGLNENEAKVYKRLLEYGEIIPSKLASLTGLTRQNTYTVLKSLKNKELVEEYTKSKILTYKPQHPRKLLDLIETQKADIQLSEDTVKAAMPTLSDLYNLSSTKSSITHLEGVGGIRTVWADALRDAVPQIYVIRSIHDLDFYNSQRLGRELDVYLKQRAARGIKTQMITSQAGAKGEIVEGPALKRITKLVPSDVFQVPVEISFSHNVVVFFTLKKKLDIFMITNQEVAQSMKGLFDAVWDADYSKK